MAYLCCCTILYLDMLEIAKRGVKGFTDVEVE
jgi:hypothetical protein